MKMMKYLMLAGVMAFGLNMQACAGSAEKNAGTAAVGSEQPADDATEEVTVETVDLVEEFTPSSTLPDSLDTPVVLDFNADWCGPCQMFKPVFHDAAKDYKGKARFISVNVDDNRDLAMKFRVSSIPQITVVKPDGQIVSTVGAMNADEFKEFLDKNL